MSSHDSGTPAQPLFSRQVRKDDRMVVSLRGLDYGDECVVEVDVYPSGAAGVEPLALGPYSFESLDEAVRFAEEALLALEYLGCSVQAIPNTDAAAA